MSSVLFGLGLQRPFPNERHAARFHVIHPSAFSLAGPLAIGDVIASNPTSR